MFYQTLKRIRQGKFKSDSLKITDSPTPDSDSPVRGQASGFLVTDPFQKLISLRIPIGSVVQQGGDAALRFGANFFRIYQQGCWVLSKKLPK